MLKAEKYDVDRIFRLIAGIVIFGLLFLLIYYLRNVLIPFVIAIIIANILDPAVDFFEDRKIPRVLSILIVFILLSGILFLLLFFGTPYVINELSQFSEILPQYIDDISEFFLEKLTILQGGDTSQNINKYLDPIIENLQSSQFIEKIFGYITSIFSQLLNLVLLLVGLVIIVMYVFFLLRDIDKLKERWHNYIPAKYRKTVTMVVSDTYDVSVNFFRGQLIIVSILGILFSIGFTIVDIRMAVLFGFAAGLLNLIPNFGTIIAIFPGLLLAVGRAAEPGGGDPIIKIISVLIVFAVVQGVQDIILTPTIMGKRTGLRPATILFSVFIWGKLLGFLGVILAIPLTCLTNSYFAKFILKENPESPKKET
ncbi:MAG: AI-2E family transporter [bacterium]|nr:AI-2E family transporter [bacterium]